DDAALPTGLDAVSAVPGQRGDDVQPVAPGHQLRADAGHDLAGRGGVGGVVRAQDEQLHDATPSSRSARGRPSAAGVPAAPPASAAGVPAGPPPSPAAGAVGSGAAAGAASSVGAGGTAGAAASRPTAR